MWLVWFRQGPFLRTRGVSFVARLWVVTAVLLVAGAAGVPARAAGAPEPPPRLSLEMFNLGGGVRVYLAPRLAVTGLVESKSEGGQPTGYAHLGLVLISPRDFYEWEMYGGAGASYTMSGAGSLGTGAWRPYLQVGAQFDILFLEYHLRVDRTPTGWLRYGIRVMI